MLTRIRRISAVDALAFAFLSWIPPLFTSRGLVSADTKSYLYIDPTRVLREATSMWNPHIGNGTVTHQMLGYLWPMGPFFKLFDSLGVADWIAQRLWWGLLVFVAAWGTRRLALAMGVSRTSALVAAAMYAFSPYFLQYFARLSGLLMPWAGLPWLMWCVYRGRTESTWKWPALFALIVGTVGTVNATSLVMVGVGPVLWLIADVLSKTCSMRRVLTFAFRTGLLCVGVSLWWLVGLLIQGSYGLPILRYTESYETVAKASSPQELLRGLGYWFFYGGDKLGRWVGPSVPYLTRPLVMLAGWTACGLALLSLSLVKSRHKFHFVFVLVCALGIAVGAAPLSSPSPYGRLFDIIVHNESGFALRSTPRAAPVVLLMLALSLAFGIDRLRVIEAPNRFRWSSIMALITVACVAINFHPWFLARSTTPSILRDSSLPTYWTELANTLNEASAPANRQHPQRVYETPGSDFANYTWGGTIDPITPGIVDGGYIARELVPYGSDATADLLNAFEARLQEGWYEQGSLSRFAEFMSSTNVVLRNDLQHERYRTPRPEILWRVLADEPNLQRVYTGPDSTATNYLPIIDNSTYGAPAVDSYPTVVGWSTTHPKPLLTVAPINDVVQLSGSGDGIVDALSAQLINPADTVVYQESIRLARLQQFTDEGRSVVTDSNRKSPRRWFSVGSNLGRVERADETPLHDPTDNRLMPFINDSNAVPSPKSQTVSQLVGDIEAISATSFGNQVTYTPEDRPENAFDGNPFTAWRVGVFSTTTGQHISARLRRLISPNAITVSQPTTGVTVRKIARFKLTLKNSGNDETRTVNSEFGSNVSTTVKVPQFAFDDITFEVLSDSFGERTDYAAAPGVGLAEISIPGVSNTEFLRVPSDSSSATPSFVFTRRRIDPATPNRFDPDDVLRRIFTVRKWSSYSLIGALRINPYATDRRIAELIGQSEKSFASAKADGNILATGLNARDGNLDTAWISPIDSPAGSRLVTDFGARGDTKINVFVKDSSMYSLPAELIVRTAKLTQTVSLGRPDSAGRIEATLREPLDGPVQSITISAVTQRTFPDYFSNVPRILPVAVTELYTTSMAPPPSRSLREACRNDLLAVDGEPISVRLEGTTDILLAGGTASVIACDGPVNLSAGEHRIGPVRDDVSPWTTGWNLDRLVLTPAVNADEPTRHASARADGVSVIEVSTTRVTADVQVAGPSVLAFAQSINSGWQARLVVDSRTIDLGRPFVVNGYANGWIVPKSGRITLEWMPQRRLAPAMGVSLFTFVSCVGCVIVADRRRRLVKAESRSTCAESVESVPWWIIPAALCIFGGPLPGLLAVAGAFLRPRLATLIGLIIGGGTVSWIVASQWYYRWPPNLDWPGRFSAVTWLAVAFLTVAGTRERTTV